MPEPAFKSPSLVEEAQSLERLEDVRAQLALLRDMIGSLFDQLRASPENIRVALESDFLELDSKARSRIAKFAHEVADSSEFQRSAFAALESSVKDMGAAL